MIHSTQHRIPIAVFAYNRPEHLRLALESIGRCEGYDECSLHIYCDAPKDKAAGRAVDVTRGVAWDWVRECGGRVIERESNFGFRNITDGITEMCEECGRVIVVEDDLIVSPDFLVYMRAGLKRYEHEQRVHLISGWMYAVDHPRDKPLFFLPYSMVWGWATWAHAWSHYSWKPNGWRKFLADPERRRHFDMDGRFGYSRMLEDTMTGKLNTWDIQWNFIVFNRDGLGLYPFRSLVWNTGFGTGVHFQGQHKRVPYVHGDLTPVDFRTPRLHVPFAFPETIQANEEALDRLGAMLGAALNRPRPSWPFRFVKKAIRVLKKPFGR